MPGFQEPFGTLLVASAARAATANSGAVEVPLCDAYEFILVTSAASGTTPTLDVAIQTTPDGGTTWFTSFRFTQVTAAITHRIRVQPMQGRGEAGSIGAVADTGGALNANGIVTRKIRVLFTVGGTNPSFTSAVYVIATPRSNVAF